MAEFNTPINLVSGTSRAARWVVALLILLPGMLALTLSQAPPHYKLIWLILSAGVLMVAAGYRPTHDDARLTIHAQGRAVLDLGNRSSGNVELGHRHWVSRYVSFVRIKYNGRQMNLVVLPGRQFPGEYRRLVARLRHATQK